MILFLFLPKELFEQLSEGERAQILSQLAKWETDRSNWWGGRLKRENLRKTMPKTDQKETESHENPSVPEIPEG